MTDNEELTPCCNAQYIPKYNNNTFISLTEPVFIQYYYCKNCGLMYYFKKGD